MKHLLTTFSFLCLVWLMNSCQNEDPSPTSNNPASGEVQLAFSSVETINANGKSSLSEEFPSGSYLSIKLLSAGKSFKRTLSLTKMGSGYISEPLTLTEGLYEIVDFMVMNEENEAIYATPKEGSPLASLVVNPLPVSFNIAKGELTNINMEVVAVKGHGPKDFGYASFQIQTVPISQFSLSVFIPQDGELQLTEAQMYLLYEGDTIVNESLESGVNTITFNGEEEENYSLVVIKPGYGRYTKDFTSQELNEGSPIKVILEPAFTFVTPVNDTFMFYLNAVPGKTLFFDWGDGNIETFITGSEILYLEHPYSLEGSKFVAITGDINAIYSISFTYDLANTSSIHINHLVNLTTFDAVWTDSPSEIDFSDNLKLRSLSLGKSSIQNIDISNNLELQWLNVSITSISSIDISNNSKIQNLDIMSQEFFTSAELDKIFEILVSHSESSNPPGYPRTLSYGPNMPSAAGQANLEILINEYGWRVNYYDFIVI